MTPAQLRLLRQAKVEGELQLGGLDSTIPRPRVDVCERLREAGFLRWKPESFPGGHKRYEISAVGEQYLENHG